MTKLLPSVRASGGNPAGFADFRPMNPNGRAMPKTTRPMPSVREGKPPEADLFQIWAETAKGTPVRLGPKAPKDFLEPLLVVMNAMSATGRADWCVNPHLLPAESVL